MRNEWKIVLGSVALLAFIAILYLSGFRLSGEQVILIGFFAIVGIALFAFFKLKKGGVAFSREMTVPEALKFVKEEWKRQFPYEEIDFSSMKVVPAYFRPSKKKFIAISFIRKDLKEVIAIVAESPKEVYWDLNVSVAEKTDPFYDFSPYIPHSPVKEYDIEEPYLQSKERPLVIYTNSQRHAETTEQKRRRVFGGSA